MEMVLDMQVGRWIGEGETKNIVFHALLQKAPELADWLGQSYYIAVQHNLAQHRTAITHEPLAQLSRSGHN